MDNIYLILVLAPLVGAILAGLFGKQIGRAGSHWVTNLGVAISFALSVYVFKHIVIDGAAVYNQAVYTWLISDGIAIPPKLAVADFVGKVKGASSTLMNKSGITDQHFQWQREYGAFSLDRKRLPNHIAYVDAQKEHHTSGTTIRALEPRGDDESYVCEDEGLYIVETLDWRRELEA